MPPLQCSEDRCSDILSSDSGIDEEECKKDTKSDQECHPCMTFSECGGRGNWDSGCLGVVTCSAPDGSGNCNYPGGQSIAHGTLCVTSGKTKFNVCNGYNLAASMPSGAGTDCPDVPAAPPAPPPEDTCNPEGMTGVCDVRDGTVGPSPPRR